MNHNEVLIWIMAIGCGACILYGIYKKPSYFFLLVGRGILCSILIYGVGLFCKKMGLVSPVNLNLLSIGTGSLLGLPGVLGLFLVGIFL